MAAKAAEWLSHGLKSKELQPMKIDLGDERHKEMEGLMGTGATIVPPLPRRDSNASTAVPDLGAASRRTSSDGVSSSEEAAQADFSFLEEDDSPTTAASIFGKSADVQPFDPFAKTFVAEDEVGSSYFGAMAAAGPHGWQGQQWDESLWPGCPEEMWAGPWWGQGAWSGQLDAFADKVGFEGAPQATLQPGDVVRFQGLKIATELNGVVGVVDRYDAASGRWVVVQAGGEERFTRRENLRLDQARGFQRWPGVQAHHIAQAAMADPRCWAQWADPAAAPKRQAQAKKAASAPQARSSQAAPQATKAAAKAKAAAAKELAKTPAEATTVMMRNLPNKYTRDSLLELLDDEGFAGLCDLVYLPVDFNTKVGLGYAFVNLVTPADARRFQEHFDGFSGWAGVVGSQKVCRVSWSDAVQGVEAHVERYRNSPVMHPSVPDEYKPQLFQDGKPVPFPAPTGRIKAPRARRSGYLQQP